MDMQALKATAAAVTTQKLLPAALAAIVGLLLIRMLNRLFDKMLARSRMEKSLHSFLRSTFHVLLYVTLGLVVAGTVGFNTSSLVALLSVASLAFSLALQGTLGNVAGGVTLLTTHPFRVGDYVQVGDLSGTVKEIGLIYTRLVTLDSKDVLLPNSDVTGSRIVNYSAEGRLRADLTFTASYDSPIETVQRALVTAALSVPQVLSDPAPRALVKAYGDNSIEYVLQAWCAPKDYPDLGYAVTQNVKRCFDAAGAEMSYPHLNVHIDRPAEHE